jgi:universal stress protein A
MLKPTKILVPTDFSKYSDKALKQALDISAEYNAKVYALHVVDEKLQTTMTDDHSALIVNIDEINKLERDLANSAKERLHKQVERLKIPKDVPLIQKIVKGIPYQEILKEQEGLGVDLIVIASLGQSGIAKFLIGSVANNVLRGAKCPVLLTK